MTARSDVVVMEDGGGRGGGRECSAGERHGEERGQDVEEGRWECRLGSRVRASRLQRQDETT